MCACREDLEETANNGVWQGYENVWGRNFWRSPDVQVGQCLAASGTRQQL